MMNYAFTTGRANKRNWYMQIDLHGGPNSGVAAKSSDSASYAWRDKLYLYSFYDRVDVDVDYPADGFGLIEGFINAIVVGMDQKEYGMYFNYPDPNLDQDNAQQLYWGENLGRLQEMKALLDPDEVFYLPQSVRPAKSK